VSDDFLDAGGEQISADSVRAKISQDAQAAVDAKMQEWRDSELGIYDLESIRLLGRHVI
jgi:hypothetical protein